MKFTKIPADTFKELQLNAGVLLKNFTPSSGVINLSDILGATTGGITFTATPTYSDMGDDVDNCPKNMKELKKLETWEAITSGTFVSVNADTIVSLLGAGDINSLDTTKIVPRNDLLASDFKTLWWVGDYSDENGDTNGGFLAIKLENALNTGGFSIKSTDKGKGNFAFNYMAHYSMAQQDKVPFEIYLKSGETESDPEITG